MKTLHVLLIGALMSTFAAQSQQLKLATLAEKTVAGNQFGAQVSFQTKHNWNLGAFYQASWQRRAERQYIVDPFYGVSASAPLVQSDKVYFYFNARCGLVNKYFATVAPGVETELKVFKALTVSALMSIRMSHPSAMVKVNVLL